MPEPTRRDLGRNDPCHCGSGRKYKQCHLGKDEEAERSARAKDVAQAPETPAEAPKRRRLPRSTRRGSPGRARRTPAASAS